MQTVVRAAAKDDELPVIDTLVLAFAADPTARWCWPDPHQYLKSMPDFTRAFGGAAFGHGSAHCTDDYSGAALWLPPETHPDEEAIGHVLETTIAEPTRSELFSVFETLGSYHPEEPHWYLPLIGVDPSCQGQGRGGALMRHALQQCDRDKTPAYLESSNPRNVTLYERHGFEVVGKVQVGSSPVLIPMVRAPR